MDRIEIVTGETKIKNILEKHNIKVEDENINMEDLVKIVYENIY